MNRLPGCTEVIMPVRPLLRVVVLATLCTPLFAAQPASDPDAARLRTLFFQRDFESGAIEGAKLVRAAPADRLHLRAWHLLNVARTDRVDDALEPAKQLATTNPKSGWAWMAHAAAMHYKGGRTAEAIEAAAKAFELMPDSVDAAFLRAQTLVADAKRREEAIAFVDQHRARLGNPAELLTAKAYAFYMLSSASTPRDEAKLKAAFDTYAEARQVDPSNVNAHYLPGTYLTSLKRNEEAYDLLKRAVVLAPGSRDVHQGYWTAVKAHPKLTAEQKHAEIEADLSLFLEKHGNRPGALLTASYGARDLKQPERQRQIEDALLQKFNDSPEAEWVLIYRLRGFDAEEGRKTPEYRQALREYVGRSKHYHEGLLGETYRNLFFNLADDPSVASDELLRVLDGMTKYELTNVHLSYVGAAVKLADRRIHLQKAEQIARDAFDVTRKRVERDRSFYKSEQEFQDRLKSAPSGAHDALGWVLFAQGRMVEAEKELLKSAELSPGNRENLHHLGAFYEAKKDLARAEEYYVKALAVQALGTNPSEAALKKMYETRHGSLDGYDGYLGTIRERDRVARREKIVASRIASPAGVTPFALKSMDGRQVTLDSLKGKIVVINFWGIWCGWCVKEMPDLQKLHEKYSADADVAILTIDNDDNPGDVPPWMKQRGFTFPVLFDDGYVTKVGVHGFPTTWFLDREGRKVFEKVGWSEKLLEEFSWRVEAIRGGTTTASTGRN
jgi:tetratricopeptide (TPR) repeat protein